MAFPSVSARGLCRFFVQPLLHVFLKNVFLGVVSQVYIAIASAFDAVDAYLAHAQEEFQGYLDGPVGSEPSMQALFEAMRICWDWEWLTKNAPDSRHVRAVVDMWELLQGCLQHTLWPSPETHPWVEHVWPTVPNLLCQYMVLCRRIRGRVRGGGLDHDTWFPVEKYGVQSVTGGQMHLRLLRQMFKPVLRRNKKIGLTLQAQQCHVMRPIGMILCFVETPVLAIARFKVLPSELRPLGWGRFRLSQYRPDHRKIADQQCFPVGDLCSLGKGRMRGRWVQVCEEHRQFSREALAAALDLDPSFNRPGPALDHCWHIVRVHHRTRQMRGVEACSERWGSLMHMLWDDVAASGPDRIATRLLLRESGLACVGAPQDESFLRSLAVILVETQGKTSMLKRKLADPLHEQSQQEIRGSEQSGLVWSCHVDFATIPGCRFSWMPDLAWRHKHAPIQLPEKMRQAVLRGAREDAYNVEYRKALPMFVEDARTLAKDRAGSVLRQRMHDFLSSDLGREWRAERAALRHADLEEGISSDEDIDI